MIPIAALPESLQAVLNWPQPGYPSRIEDAAAYNSMLKRANQALKDAFYAGSDTTLLVHGRSTIMDHLLQLAWRRFDLDKATGVALVAVGGYGRCELHPYSDLDLMLLLESPAINDLAQLLSDVLIVL
jgi:UTP:GlnB (protein PII) uridylyltransferase